MGMDVEWRVHDAPTDQPDCVPSSHLQRQRMTARLSHVVPQKGCRLHSVKAHCPVLYACR